MTRTVNIITAVYTHTGDPTEYGYEKGKTYGLKLTQDDQFPIVLYRVKRIFYGRRRDQAEARLFDPE